MMESRIENLEISHAHLEADVDELTASLLQQPQTIAELQAELTRIRGQYKPTRAPVPDTAEEGELKAARQRLTEEMRRMLGDYRPPANDTTVGGIPVDSEYIIFALQVIEI